MVTATCGRLLPSLGGLDSCRQAVTQVRDQTIVSGHLLPGLSQAPWEAEPRPAECVGPTRDLHVTALEHVAPVRDTRPTSHTE